MNSAMTRKFVLAGLIAFLVFMFFGIAPAKDKKRFDAKKKEFCRLMIDHGEKAYMQGYYEKAGYYFLQAVEADPAAMAKVWYELKGIRGSEKSVPVPPAPSISSEATESPGVIMGDDEGCLMNTIL